MLAISSHAWVSVFILCYTFFLGYQKVQFCMHKLKVVHNSILQNSLHTMLSQICVNIAFLSFLFLLFRAYFCGFFSLHFSVANLKVS